MIGRARELMRGKKKHGSTGMGVGVAALDREEELANNTSQRRNVRTSLTVDECYDLPFLMKKLKFLNNKYCDMIEQEIREWKKTDFYSSETHQELKSIIESYTRANHYTTLAQWYHAWVKQNEKQIVNGLEFLQSFMKRGENVVFEGAQGALLDRTFGFYPFITKTDCSIQLALEILKLTRMEYNLQTFGVFRTYAHRHGAGPFVTEFKDNQLLSCFPELHNQASPWQGNWRLGYFDLLALQYSISFMGEIKNLSLTHADLLESLTSSAAIEDWKICTSYVYEGSESIDTLKQYFQVEKEGELVKITKINPFLVKNDKKTDTVGQILFQCRPHDWVFLKSWSLDDSHIKQNNPNQNSNTLATSALSSFNIYFPTQTLTQKLIQLLESTLSIPVRLVSFGATANDKIYIDSELFTEIMDKQKETNLPFIFRISALVASPQLKKSTVANDLKDAVLERVPDGVFWVDQEQKLKVWTCFLLTRTKELPSFLVQARNLRYYLSPVLLH